MSERFDVIVVGSGLAGLTATLELLAKGLSVVLVEKAEKLGGNSVKASSGINGAPSRFQEPGDSVLSFAQDTEKSGKGLSNPDLVDVLTKNSAQAVHWLADEFNIDLSAVSRLGGHTFARTHRGKGALPPGFAIISALTKKLEQAKNVKVMKLCSFEKFTSKNLGIEVLDDGVSKSIFGKNIVLATGGFSADFTHKSSLLKRFRPDLLDFPLTNGQQTTGDGQKIAERDLGAKLIHMDQVQVHPTGFIQLKEPQAKWKFLCGELIRGIGGVLVSPVTGQRFVNELSTRDEVTKGILENCQIGDNGAVAAIVVGSVDYLKAKAHIDFYVSQKLMFKGNAADLASHLLTLFPQSRLTPEILAATFAQYNDQIQSGDPLGRPHFGTAFSEELYFGFVTPVLHFSMGGIEINLNGQVISQNGETLQNVFAIGEVSGGVHGGNRLAGSSLLECVVFGRQVAKYISMH